MTSIFVDPIIVIMPAKEASKEEVLAWLKNLSIWLHDALHSRFTWFHLEQATVQIEIEGQFPSFLTLRELVRKYNLDMNPVLIAKDVNLFFRDESRDLDKCLEQLGYLVETVKDSITIHPDDFATRWPECIRDKMLQLFITICACKHVNDAFARKMHVATLKLSSEAREIKVSAIIIDSLPELICNEENCITQTFPLLFTPDDLLPFIDVLALWNEGESGIRYAIERRCKKDWECNHLQFRLGSHFIPSVQDVGLHTNQTVLSKIVQIAAAIIAEKTTSVDCDLRHIRISKAPDSPQRTRAADGAKAWRVTLMKHGAGWRMHYWRIPHANGDIIEFSHVCREGDAVRMY